MFCFVLWPSAAVVADAAIFAVLARPGQLGPIQPIRPSQPRPICSKRNGKRKERYRTEKTKNACLQLSLHEIALNQVHNLEDLEENMDGVGEGLTSTGPPNLPTHLADPGFWVDPISWRDRTKIFRHAQAALTSDRVPPVQSPLGYRRSAEMPQ